MENLIDLFGAIGCLLVLLYTASKVDTRDGRKNDFSFKRILMYIGMFIGAFLFAMLLIVIFGYIYVTFFVSRGIF